MYEADRAEVALNLITLPKLRQLIVDFYDKLDSETRALASGRCMQRSTGGVANGGSGSCGPRIL
ncbi:MAG TPA: hypothetical protein VGI10_01200 [Polyangiaceae bacterium]|jgi:hypothetical protein